MSLRIAKEELKLLFPLKQPSSTSDDDHSELSDLGRGYHSDYADCLDDFDLQKTPDSSHGPDHSLLPPHPSLSSNNNGGKSAKSLENNNNNNNTNSAMSSNSEPSGGKEKRLNALKRTLSGKFRKEKLEQPKKREEKQKKLTKQTSSHALIPRDNTLHNLIRKNVSAHQFSKILKKIVHVDARDENDQTPLHICCNLGNLDLLKILLKKGANVNHRDMNGFTPLHCSLIASHLHISEHLLRCKDIDVTITNNQTASALHYLVRIPVNDSNIVPYRVVLDLLINNAIDVNLQNKQGETALHSACLKTNFHTAALLIERGADCNLLTSMGEGSLHYAIRYGNTRLVRLLLENGADPTIMASDGSNAVDIAEQYGQNEILDCIESIIGEAMPVEAIWNQSPRERSSPDLPDVHSDRPSITTLPQNSYINSPRYKLNANEVQEGWLEVFLKNECWSRVWVRVSHLFLVCYSGNLCEEVLLRINLTSAEVAMEEGTIMNEEELYWCFTVAPVVRKNTVGQSLLDDVDPFPKQLGTVFGTRNPDLRDDWFSFIEKIISTHRNLDKVYDKLRSLSGPRLKLRSKCKSMTQSVTLRGVELLHSLITKNFNNDFITNTIVQNITLAAPGLSEVIDISDDHVCQVIVRFLLHKNIFLPFLKNAINYDIGKSSIGDTLFREVSLSTRILSTYLEGQEGRDYLKATVLILVNAMANIDSSLEINPTNSSEHIDINLNIARICELSQLFLDRVMLSISRFPLKFREIMQYTKKVVDSMYPNMTHAVIGGFVFLRYLCPAIVSPEKYNLISKPLNIHTTRGLVLISKLLQSVSNGVEFDGSKEKFMTQLNPFIIKNRLYVNIFFDNLTNKESIKSQRLDNTQTTKFSKSEAEAAEHQFAEVLRNCLPRMKDYLKDAAL